MMIFSMSHCYIVVLWFCRTHEVLRVDVWSYVKKRLITSIKCTMFQTAVSKIKWLHRCACVIYRWKGYLILFILFWQPGG